MAGKKISELTEVMSVTDKDYVVVAREGSNNKLKVMNMMGSTNVGADYVDLKSHEDDTEYRLIINNDGKVQVFPKDSVEGHIYAEGDNLQMPLTMAAMVGDAGVKTANCAGIVINQAYGGGKMLPTSTLQSVSVSHSFVELYNRNTVDINLCGLYLHYKGNGDTVWQTLALRGTLPSHHAFLIRGAQHGDMNSDLVRCKIYDYDQEFIGNTGTPIALSSKGMSLYLSTSATAPGIDDNPAKYTEIKDGQGVVTSTEINKVYVDLLAAAGEGDVNPSAYLKYFWTGMNKDTAIRRVDFYNNLNNKFDARLIDYKTCNIDHYRPRSLRDGVWDNYCDKVQPNFNIPNLVNITFGKEATTRLFTWQSIVTNEGVVKYRRIKDASGSAVTEAWKEVESEREIVNNHGTFMTVHRAKITTLTPGLYEYQCGEPGYWSDVELLEVKQYDTTSTLNLLWTTDQQGFTEEEYDAWKVCVKAIKSKPEYYNAEGIPVFDFHLNTGDISQNASNLFEWLYYSKYAKEFCSNIPHMITCGNNDLVDKKYGTAFNNYATFEGAPKLNDFIGGKTATVNQEMVSTYSFDMGHTHFICLNSNDEQMYTDYGIQKADFLLKQSIFLDRDLYQVSKREVKPRWVVVFAHLSPFTVTRAVRLQHWIPVLEHYGVDLFLCGHNHTYSRSIPIKCGYSGLNDTTKYNTYETTKSSYTAVDELTKDGSEIDRASHPTDGTYYVMFQAGGAKQSGKEKAIVMRNNAVFTGLEEKHYSTVATASPWWYGFTGALPKHPCFSTLSITNEAINMNMYTCTGSIAKDAENGIVSVSDYSSIDKFDTFTINAAERTPAYRTGVAAPYYDENKDK